MTPQVRCPRCGMDQAEWSENAGLGYTEGETTYCCQGCAEDTGCTCEPAPAKHRPRGRRA